MHTFVQTPIKQYSSEWKKVDELVGKGLDKDALEQVKKIQGLAKNENQDAQVVKASFYRMQLQAENREDNAVESIRELEKDISESKEPARSILNSLLANTYLAYYQTVRWKLYDRTATVNFDKTDIATWGTQDFHRKIGALYLESIQNEALLKKTGIEPYEAIITKGNARHLRPTLFDLLAFKALEYFSSDERDIEKPAYAFEISTASAFDPAADFVHRKFETKDTSSLEYHALLLYQKLIALHIDDPRPDALIDADLARLQYVREKSVHPDKDELYFLAISHLADQYQSTPAAAQAWFLKAAALNERANGYKPGNDSLFRFERVKALEICQRIVRENPDTEGGINAQNLTLTITAKSLNCSVEMVNNVNKPFRIFVRYKNVGTLHLRVIKLNDYLRKSLEENSDHSKWTRLSNAQALKSWEQSLPDTKDYQEHSVEIKAESLPSGEYMLLASSDAGFIDAKEALGATAFYVSDISFVQKEDDFFVLERDTGQPLAGAKVQLWTKDYDNNTRSFAKNKGALFTTDGNGHFKRPPIAPKERNKQHLLEITFQNDKLFLHESTNRYYYRGETEPDQPTDHVYLFTDRSLYRPGQTVYYKGIVNKGDKASQDPKAEYTVALYNANSEHVAETKHRLNAYGSFSGSFSIPQNGLTGSFYLEVRDEYRADFHVEEYKRPRFAAEFDTLKATYKFNDTIKLTGKATAYAGNAIDGANVKYRVVRTPRMIYTWRMRSWWNPSAPLEITHGETVTDATGMFHIDFQAIPDLKVDAKLDPIFDYVIYADVTDSNGETRSAQTSVSVSYKSYVLKANVPERSDLAEFQSLSIRTENLAGVFAPADATVRMGRITPEKRLIRNRLWPKPDLFVMTRQDFIANFPHDEYNDETEMENWQVTGEEVQKNFTLEADGQVPVSGYNLSPGFYKITIITSNAAGEKLTDVKFIELTDPNSKRLIQPQYLVPTGSLTTEPGEKGHYALGTSAEKAFVVSSTNRKSGHKGFSFLTLSDEIRKFDFIALEEDRGGFTVDYMFIKHNRLHTYSETVTVPWTNKDLRIEYETFRDKTLPASKETWKIRISGYKKEQVAAEMLVSMYDVSLDQFYHHQWMKPHFWPTRVGLPYWHGNGNFETANPDVRHTSYGEYKYFDKRYDQLIWGRYLAIFMPGRPSSFAGGGRPRTMRMMSKDAIQLAAPKSAVMTEERDSTKQPNDKNSGEALVSQTLKQGTNGAQPSTATPAIRKNFNETAFFFPDLKTDREGNITFSFTLPEALTKWKFQALAHTADLAVGYSSKEIVTQKELMVQPNAPRFFREGDRIRFPVKIANVSGSAINGHVTLSLLDAVTGESIDAIFKNNGPSSQFSIAAGQSTTAFFTLEIPKGFNNLVTWRTVAKAGNLSDGEENMLPVLSNRMLVTESLPLSMRGAGQKHFSFDKLKQSEKSSTLTHQSVTVEYSSNPAWYAVQSLPYLMEYPYECAEQTWNRYYANTLAAHILHASPHISQVFKSWNGTAAMQSNLAKNEELKSLVLQETPWVMQGKSEEEQKRNIALLFDLARMENELNGSIRKLQEMQSSNGGFVWFKGGPDDRYITQYIVTGIGHLQKLKAFDPSQEASLNDIVEEALPYLDKCIQEDYDRLIQWKTDLKTYAPGPTELQYLYARSFFANPIPDHAQKAYQYYRERARLTWLSQTKLLQGMTALVCNRTQDAKTAHQILASLRQTAVRNEELGMYWQTQQRGWWWHEAPIERQALLIEAFQEIANDQATVADLKTWLLKNKQTNNWESTKATAEACYALLMQGSDWLSENPQVSIALGKTTINQNEEKVENVTGYFKKAITRDISKDMGNISVQVSDAKSVQPAPSWGAVYWQYFEDLDKITFAETPLKLSKQLFVETNTDNGPLLTPVREDGTVKIGDKIKVRIELRVDRDMEYVHMKDMRASALEPVNALSGYRWQGSLGYYESTRDASTNFFFSALRKGTYVFEYPLFVTHEGDFSNGITTIQCMYAPEFTAHSEGVRVRVVAKK